MLQIRAMPQAHSLASLHLPSLERDTTAHKNATDKTHPAGQALGWLPAPLLGQTHHTPPVCAATSAAKSVTLHKAHQRAGLVLPRLSQVEEQA